MTTTNTTEAAMTNPIDAFVNDLTAELDADARRRGYLTAAQLTERLNTAAERAGQAADYVVVSYTDNTDSWADYSGFAVTGPDTDRALNWLKAAVAEWQAANPAKPHSRSNGVTRHCEIREHNGTRYVCQARYYIGD